MWQSTGSQRVGHDLTTTQQHIKSSHYTLTIYYNFIFQLHIIKAGNKETVFDYNIKAKVEKISIPSTIKIVENETKKLNPYLYSNFNNFMKVLP